MAWDRKVQTSGVVRLGLTACIQVAESPHMAADRLAAKVDRVLRLHTSIATSHHRDLGSNRVGQQYLLWRTVIAPLVRLQLLEERRTLTYLLTHKLIDHLQETRDRLFAMTDHRRLVMIDHHIGTKGLLRAMTARHIWNISSLQDLNEHLTVKIDHRPVMIEDETMIEIRVMLTGTGRRPGVMTGTDAHGTMMIALATTIGDRRPWTTMTMIGET